MTSSRRDRLPPAWLIALLVVVAFAFQGTRGVWEPDEGRYSAAGINMHLSGDWLVPTLDRVHPHLTKPPVTYWALAASFGLLGHNEWAMRLPGALAFVGTGLLVFGLGRRLCPARPWLPPTIWALSLAPVIAANIVATDPLLVFFETAAMYAFVRAWSQPRAGTQRWLLAMWLAWGLAFMTKGPPGLLPLLAVVPFLAGHDRPLLRRMFAPAGLLVFAVVGLTWYAVIVAQQPDRLGYFLGHEVYDRVFTPKHDRNSAWYGALEVYVPVLLVGTLPWSVIATICAGGPRAAWHQWRERLRQRQPEWQLLTYWLLVPLIVFFLARSRLHLYVLPLFVPLALIMARPISDRYARTGGRFGKVVLITAVSLVALKGALAHWPSDRDARTMAAALQALAGTRPVDGIVFVSMEPWFGLAVYLDVPIEGIQVGEHKFTHSRYVAPEDFCAEITQAGNELYGMRGFRVGPFVAAAGRCNRKVTRLGSIAADDAVLHFFRFEPAGH